MLELMPADTAGLIQGLDLRVVSKNLPRSVENQLNETFLVGGKKVRPALCFLMGQVMGLNAEKLSAYARAAELTHMASLAHDDVIDEADRRRNLPSLNSATSNAAAVLAGDLLLARVMSEISSLGNIHIIRDLANAVEDLVTGELLQLENRGKLDVPFASLERVSVLKTGSLMSWCCMVGARLLNRGDELVSASRQFGESLGVAFQMIDDILDFETTSEKPYAQDLREGLVNFVGSELVYRNPALRSEIQKCLGVTHPTQWPWTEAELQAAKTEIRARASLRLTEAREKLNEIQKLSGAMGPDSSHAMQALNGVLTFLALRVV